MNDRAREVLIKAAMDNVPQIKGILSDNNGGYCAMGVLIKEAAPLFFYNKVSIKELVTTIENTYAIDEIEWKTIVYHNNIDEWDFLTIARKM